MASRRDKRIEPSFGDAQSTRQDGLSVREEDRVVPSRKASARKRKAKAKSGRSRRSGRGGGLLRLGVRLAYWCCVLGLWGGIAVAGIVVYYGAKMPAILVETSFLSHPDEEVRLADDAYQTKVAASISEAVEGFLEERNKLAQLD